MRPMCKRMQAHICFPYIRVWHLCVLCAGARSAISFPCINAVGMQTTISSSHIQTLLGAQTTISSSHIQTLLGAQTTISSSNIQTLLGAQTTISSSHIQTLLGAQTTLYFSHVQRLLGTQTTISPANPNPEDAPEEWCSEMSHLPAAFLV